jgi:hypothetical protein
VRARLAALLSIVLVLPLLGLGGASAQAGPPSGQVVFPTDALTVADPSQLTGRRLDLGKPDCEVERSVCAEIDIINTLDGFDLDPRITVQLEAAPAGDLAELFDEATLYVEPTAGGERIGLNRFVLDPGTNQLHGQPVEQLRESTEYRAVYKDSSVTFTTLSASAGLVQMRRQLDDGSAYEQAGIAPDARAISFTQGELRTVFPAAQVLLINRYDEVVPNGELREELVIDSAQLLSSAGTYAFGSLTVPSWLDADSTIPDVPTGGAGPQVLGSETIGITVILPQGSPPDGGWPVALFGPGITRSKYDIYLIADFNAARGVATISFDPVGHAYGPRSEVGVQTSTDFDEVRFSGFGRGRDLNSDGVIANDEGVQAPIPPHPRSSIGLRDGLRQTTADVMAIRRALGTGTDVTGDGTVDLSGADVSFYALSLGGIYGSMLMGADPSIEVAVLNVPGGPIADIARLGSFRYALTEQLRNRIPAQLNGGRSGFTEDRPLFLDPPVTEPTAGAVAIQDTITRANWISRPGSPEAFAPRIERDPPPDAQPKRVVYQFAYGDQVVPNPTSATLARAFGNLDQVVYYRNDRTPTADRDPHGLLADPTITGRQEAQLQAVEWIASNGETLLPLNPLWWEVPIADLDVLEEPNFSEEVLGEEVPAPAGEVVRVSGSNRIATAAAISAETHEDADVVVIARADEFADALAGGPLAVHLGAPLLLSAPEALSTEAAAEIERLGASEAVLLGGVAALSAAVEDELTEAGLDVRRVSGTNRFATAAAIAEALPFSSEVFVTEGANADPGRGWPDALSAAPVASALGQPILLTTRDILPAETVEALSQPVHVTIVGGEAAVSGAVAAEIDEAALVVRRVFGADRYGTSRAMAVEAMRRGLSPEAIWVATGRAFADGLVAGAAAGADHGLLLLADTDDLAASAAPQQFLTDHAGAFDRVRIAGGVAAISQQTAAQIGALLR